MADIKALQKKINDTSAEAKKLYGEMEADDAKRTPENREKLEKLIADGKAFRADLDLAKEVQELDDFANAPASEPKAAGDPSGSAPAPQRKSFGRQVVESEEYKNNPRKAEGKMNPVLVPHLMKGLYNTTDAQGGYAVRADRETEILDIARQRPLTIMDLIMVGQTTVDAVEYVEMSSRTNNAAVVPEWDSAKTPGDGDYGLKYGDKPQGDLTLNLRTATVKTIAEWIPASRQILADAPNLRSMVDNELIYQLMITLENQILTGNGSGNNFTGINNWSGIQTRQHRNVGVDRGALADDTLGDTIRRSLTDVRLEFYEPDGIVLNPTNGEAIELEKDDNGNYLKVYDPVAMRMWRVRVLETQAQTANIATVAQFKLGAKMWDREDANIRVGEPGNFFLQNAVAILAELRAAFAVTRPKAIEKVNLVSA
jgi:HK97 family phage major capsid protein